MKEYDSYKDSGIEYLNKIPAHWQELRMRFIGYLYGGLSGKSANDFNQLTNEDNKCFIPFTNIANNFRIDPESLQTVVIAENEKQNKVKKGDLFFLMSSENYDDVGKSAVLLDDLEETYLNSFCKGFRITKENIVPKFLNYQLHSKQLRHNLLTGANGFTRINLKIDKVIDLLTALPPLVEQTSIASFLDRKTSEIDEIIADKKRLLELYEEEKTAIINQAVTKGLDPNAPMKDSGIEWLGEIPEHWEVKKINWSFENIGSGTTPKADNQLYYYNGNINWLLTGDLNDGEIYDTSKKITQKAIEDYGTLRVYPAESIVMAMYGATIGKLGMLKIETTVNQACCVLSKPIYFDNKFAFYVLLAARPEIINMSYGGGQPNISQELIKSFRLPVPPINEQQSIVHHIESECSKIDFKKARTEELIELLTEYRTALISEAVTGKIKVTED